MYNILGSAPSGESLLDLYEKYIHSNDRNIKVEVQIGNSDLIIGHTHISNISISYNLTEDSDFEMGIFTCAELSLTVKKSVTISEGTKLRVVSKLQVFDRFNNEIWVAVPIGVFYVNEVTNEYLSKTIKAYDRAFYFAKENLTLDNETGTTIGAIIDNINANENLIKKFGSPVITKSKVPNQEYPVYSTDLTGISVREALGYIAGTIGGYVCMDEDDELKFFTLNDTFRTYTWDKFGAFEIQDYIRMISRLECSSTVKDSVTGEIFSDITINAGDGLDVYDFENPFITSETQLNTVFNDTSNKLNGLSYRPCSLKLQGDPRLRIGDFISVEAQEKTNLDKWCDTTYNCNTYSLPIMRLTIKHNNGCMLEIEAVADKDRRRSLYRGGSIAEQLRALRKQVEKASGDAQSAKNELNYARSDYETLGDRLNQMSQDTDTAIKGVQINENSITAAYGKFDTIEARMGDFETLYADKAYIEELYASKAYIEEAYIDKAEIKELYAEKAYVEELKADIAEIDEAYITKAVINDLTAEDAEITQATIAAAIIESAEIQEAVIEKASIQESFINKAVVNSLDVSKVNADQIAVNSIQAQHIDINQITTDHIQANAITSEKINANSINADHIQAKAITTEKIDADAITADKIQADAITADKIKAGNIETDHINTETIVAEHLQSHIISNDFLDSGAVSTDNISAYAIVAQKIATNAVTADKIIANAVTADKIQANAVTAEKIKAGSIEADHITTDAIKTQHITANAIVAEKIMAEAITTEKIKAEAITADKIKTGAITAECIDVEDLTAEVIMADAFLAAEVSANNITAGKLKLGNGLSIESEDTGTGKLLMSADRLQFIEPNNPTVNPVNLGNVRVQLGKYSDAIDGAIENNYGLIVMGYKRDNDGNLVYENGKPVYDWIFDSDRGLNVEMGLQYKSLTTDKIADMAITKDKIGDGAVTEEKIIEGAVTAGKIKTGAITSDKIKADSIKSEHIQANAITATQLSTEAITSEHIKADVIQVEHIKGKVTFEALEGGDLEGFFMLDPATNATVINGGALYTQSIYATDLHLRGQLSVYDDDYNIKFAVQEDGDLLLTGDISTTGSVETSIDSQGNGYFIKSGGDAQFKNVALTDAYGSLYVGEKGFAGLTARYRQDNAGTVLWVGQEAENRSNAPFRVSMAGNVTANTVSSETNESATYTLKDAPGFKIDSTSGLLVNSRFGIDLNGRIIANGFTIEDEDGNRISMSEGRMVNSSGLLVNGERTNFSTEYTDTGFAIKNNYIDSIINVFADTGGRLIFDKNRYLSPNTTTTPRYLTNYDFIFGSTGLNMIESLGDTKFIGRTLAERKYGKNANVLVTGDLKANSFSFLHPSNSDESSTGKAGYDRRIVCEDGVINFY